MKKLILILLLVIPIFSFAATAQPKDFEYQLLAPLPCIDCGSTDVVTSMSPEGYLGYVYKFSIALAVALAVIMIIWGGVEYMGSEVPFIKSNGRTRIQNAAIGLVLILSSYLILETIDPRLVNIEPNIPQIDPKKYYIEDDLAANFNNLAIQDQLKANELKKERGTLDEKISAYRDSAQGGPLTEADQKEYEKLVEQRNKVTIELEKNKLAGESKAAIGRIQQAIFISKDRGILDSTYDLILGTDTTDLDGLHNQKEAMIKVYITAIENIKTINPEEAKNLVVQRNFYSGLIEEDIKIHEEKYTKTQYEAMKQQFQDNIANAKEVEKYGIQASEYTALMNKRIEILDKKISVIATPKATTLPVNIRTGY